MDVCHIQLIGECIAVKKSLQNCTTCPIVPLSQQEMVFLSKLLYINILSFLLHLFFVIWEDGKMGKWENGNFGKNALSFPLSCHLLKVYICHASYHSICRIYRNRVVKLAVVCLTENV